MTPNYRILITKMADELDQCHQLLMDDRRQRHPLADRARALLAEPEAEGPTIPSRYRGHEITVYRDGFHAGYKEALAIAAEPVAEGPTDEELREMLNENDWNYISPETFEDIARTVLAQWGRPAAAPVPEQDSVIPVKQHIFPTPSQAAECEGPCYEGNYCPEACDCGLYRPPALAKTEAVGPTDEELASFLAERHRTRMENESPFGCPDFDGAKAKAARIADIRAAIARWGRPAAAPAPVSERLPGPEDCDEQGRCWRYIDPEESMGNPMWELARSKYAGANYGSVAWLAAHAIPLLQTE